MGSLVNRVVLRLLTSTRALRRSVVGLEVRGRVTGRPFRFPVQYAETADGELVVVPGRPESKTWWRNVSPTGTPVRVLDDGSWSDREARRLSPSDPPYADATAAYRRRWPRAVLPEDQPVIVLRPGNPDRSLTVEPVD